jgi:hypothetical protein
MSTDTGRSNLNKNHGAISSNWFGTDDPFLPRIIFLRNFTLHHPVLLMLTVMTQRQQLRLIKEEMLWEQLN